MTCPICYANANKINSIHAPLSKLCRSHFDWAMAEKMLGCENEQ